MAPTVQKEPSSAVAAASNPGPPVSPTRFALGIIFLSISVLSTLLLVLEHFGGLSLPGCGPGSACAQAAASVWGKVPVIGWPVSFLGLSFFLAMLVGWISSRAGISSAYRYGARLGVLVSLFYIFVIAIGKYGCKYCLAAHAGNFAFWLVAESARVSIPRSIRPVPLVGGVFALSLAVLAVAQSSRKASVEKKGQQELADSTKAIIEASTKKTDEVSVVTPPTTTPQIDPRLPPWQGCFTGRHRTGPAESPIRIVIFSDYQCPDCNRTEFEIEPLLKSRPDISFGFRHYPMCAQCNPNIKDKNWCPHPNACWAARAAEAASMLHGEDGFWQMHRWLFARKGSFTPDELRDAVISFGYNHEEFVRTMTSQQTLDNVLEDLRFGTWLGLHYTPMIFINGVELKGVFTRNAVPTAVASLTAANPPPKTCEADRPVPAVEKYVEDWVEQKVYALKRLPQSWPFGRDDAPMQIFVWGDYQEPNTKRVDQIIRQYMEGKPGIQYVWRHFPVDMSCNPHTSVNAYPWGCKASSAAVAAGLIGGADAYAKMHAWLFSNQRQFTDDEVKKAAESFGLPGDQFIARLNAPETRQIIVDDAGVGKALDLRQVPTIFINGKPVPRWNRNEESMLEPMLDLAYKTR